MTERHLIDCHLIDDRARAFFEDLWTNGDPWDLDRSEFERERYAHLIGMLDDRRYGRTLEIGCGAGAFTRQLAALSEHTVAVDISPIAIEQARARCGDLVSVEFRAANIMDGGVATEGPWDLVVMSETIYYLGWLYPFFNVGWLAWELLQALRPGGRLLLANTRGVIEDYLLLPWLISTYRDLFPNVGYDLEREEVFLGTKSGTELEVLISLFARCVEPAPRTIRPSATV